MQLARVDRSGDDFGERRERRGAGPGLRSGLGSGLGTGPVTDPVIGATARSDAPSAGHSASQSDRQAGNALGRLVALARETAREQRIALLRQITDIYIDDEQARQGKAGDHSDVILTRLTGELDPQHRRAVSQRFADAPAIPPRLAKALVMDTIEVAAPVLRGRVALKPEILVECVRLRGREHQEAIAQRPQVSQPVSEALVEAGHGEVLALLLANAGAKIGERAMEGLIDLAANTPQIHGPLVRRADTPLHLLQELYFLVNSDLRAKILARSEKITAAQLSVMIDRSRKRLHRQVGKTPSDYESARRFVEGKALRRQLDGALLVDQLQRHHTTRFLAGLAHLCGVEFGLARRAVARDENELLATLCRVAGIERECFVPIVLYRPYSGETPPIDTEELGARYDTIDRDTAAQVLRFWQVRRHAAAGR